MDQRQGQGQGDSHYPAPIALQLHSEAHGSSCQGQSIKVISPVRQGYRAITVLCYHRQLLEGAAPAVALSSVTLLPHGSHAAILILTSTLRDIIGSIPIGWLTSSQFELPPGQPSSSSLAPLSTHPVFASLALTSWFAMQVEADSGSATGHWVLLKGAPEVVQPMLEQVPGDFEAAYKQFASQGAR